MHPCPSRSPTNHMDKAQSSIELGILLAMLLVVAVVVLNTSFGRDSLGVMYQERLAATEVTEKLSVAINEAHLGGDGTQSTATLPSLIRNANYTISIAGNTVTVFYRGHVRQAGIITRLVNVTSLAPGTQVAVRNVGGVIVVG